MNLRRFRRITPPACLLPGFAWAGRIFRFLAACSGPATLFSAEGPQNWNITDAGRHIVTSPDPDEDVFPAHNHRVGFRDTFFRCKDGGQCPFFDFWSVAAGWTQAAFLFSPLGSHGHAGLVLARYLVA